MLREAAPKRRTGTNFERMGSDANNAGSQAATGPKLTGLEEKVYAASMPDFAGAHSTEFSRPSELLRESIEQAIEAVKVFLKINNSGCVRRLLDLADSLRRLHLNTVRALRRQPFEFTRSPVEPIGPC
jgi:hypothetical protein